MAKYLMGYLIAHILFISIVQSFLCRDLKIIELGLIVLVFGIAVINSKKINLDKSDITIAFLLVSYTIFFAFIELRGLIYFKMTYVLLFAMLLSKVILPNISLKKYFETINTIYIIVLAFLVIEYIAVTLYGDKFLVDLFMCNGEKTGVRGYIELYNLTREILPFHTYGLNSIMLAQHGGQTASQLAVIIFIWFIYKYKNNKNGVYLSLALLAILILFLSPSLTSLFLLFITILILYLVHLKGVLNEQINPFNLYLGLFLAILFFYLIYKIMQIKYPTFNYIFDEFVLKNIAGFGYFDFKEILFGIAYERKNDLFKVTEISFLNQIISFGFVGISLFYFSIFYYIVRAFGNINAVLLFPNIFIIVIFIIGNAHYPVMFNLGVMELFILHLAYIIYIGSEKNTNEI